MDACLIYGVDKVMLAGVAMNRRDVGRFRPGVTYYVESTAYMTIDNFTAARAACLHYRRYDEGNSLIPLLATNTRP